MMMRNAKIIKHIKTLSCFSLSKKTSTAALKEETHPPTLTRNLPGLIAGAYLSKWRWCLNRDEESDSASGLTRRLSAPSADDEQRTEDDGEDVSPPQQRQRRAGGPSTTTAQSHHHPPITPPASLVGSPREVVVVSSPASRYSSRDQQHVDASSSEDDDGTSTDQSVEEREYAKHRRAPLSGRASSAARRAPAFAASCDRDADALSAGSSQQHRGSRPILKKRKKKSVRFSHPVVQDELLVPALVDIPTWVREDMYWGSEDYAAIRDNQRRLIELVMRQVRELPEGLVPPPIHGESRRGLGIICEPGTNSGRAARVRSARRAVVEAHRDGYSAEMIGRLAAELSLWATKNAYDVGLKDHEAVGDFDLDSFRVHQPDGVAASRPVPRLGASPVARAHRRDSDDNIVVPGAQQTQYSASQQRSSTDGPPAPVAHHHHHHGSSSSPSSSSSSGGGAQPPASPQPDPTPDAAGVNDGLGLASLIRNDSLNNLSAMTPTTMSAEAPSPAATESSSASRGPPDAALSAIAGPILTAIGGAPAPAEEVPQDENDGLGLASMIRNDSLGNLAALARSAAAAARADDTSSESASSGRGGTPTARHHHHPTTPMDEDDDDEPLDVDGGYPVEAY